VGNLCPLFLLFIFLWIATGETGEKEEQGKVTKIGLDMKPSLFV
jgi:hypothetical protein